MNEITAVIVPKWGLSMSEGTIVHWHHAEGDTVSDQADLVDIETAKITNVGLAPASGVLRRIIAGEGEVRPVGALIGVIADRQVDEARIDAFIADFQHHAAVTAADAAPAETLAKIMVETALGPLSVGRAGPADALAVVLIHGFGADSESWGFTIEALAQDRQILAFDLPGHGQSTRNVGDGSVQTMAAAMDEALRQLGVAHMDLIGHSLGAAVALALAQRLAQRPGKLVLISPAGLGQGGVSAEFLDGLLNARRKRELRAVLEMLAHDAARISDELVEAMIRFRRLDGVLPALGLLRDRIIDGSQFAGLDAIARDHDALCITGDADRIVSGAGEGLRRRVIADCGHMPHIEKPGDVNALILAELN